MTSNPPEAIAFMMRADASSTAMPSGSLMRSIVLSAVSTKPALMTWMRMFILEKS